jgi:hypothetical protein
MSNETLVTETATTTEGAAPETAVTTTESQPVSAEVTAEQQQQTATEANAEVQKPEWAPDKYEFTNPEGAEMAPEGLTAFSDFAREQGMTQAAAQSLLDKLAPAMAKRQADVMTAARESWANSAKADKEFGGDKLNENLGIAKKALDAFGTPELRTLLNESGIGNHPEVIRMLLRAGKAISEDRFVGGGRGGQVSTDPAKRLFPNMA